MITKITRENFRAYGWVIEYPKKHLKGKTKNLFRIVLTEKGRQGWRIAYLIVRDTTIKRLECHPHSFESFEPVRGRSLIFVAKEKDERTIECFAIDRPIILKKNIWHGVVTLSNECEIKLTENAKVKCVYWPLSVRLRK
jgi:ureidoglycolate hydrolase